MATDTDTLSPIVQKYAHAEPELLFDGNGDFPSFEKLVLLDRLTTIAAWLIQGGDGFDPDTYHGSPEQGHNYIRGQVELIADAVGLISDSRDVSVPYIIHEKVSEIEEGLRR